jgi:hypothetical protein
MQTKPTETEPRLINTAAQLFAVGQRVRVLPHPGAPHLTGREGTIVGLPEPSPVLGRGDYGANVEIDGGLTWHLYSHRIESAERPT